MSYITKKKSSQELFFLYNQLNVICGIGIYIKINVTNMSVLDVDSVVNGINEVDIIRNWLNKNTWLLPNGDYVIDQNTHDINIYNREELILADDVENFPDYIHFGYVSDMNISFCKNLTSLKGFPKRIMNLFISGSGIEQLSNREILSECNIKGKIIR